MGLLVACGGDDDDEPPDAAVTTCRDVGGAACFQLPTAPMRNRDGEPSAIGCGPIVPNVSTEPVTFSGDVARYGTGDLLPGAEVFLYDSPEFATPIASAISAGDATYSVVVPAGSPDVLWSEYSAGDLLPMFVHAYRVDLGSGDVTDFNLRLFKPDDIESAAFRVQELWDPSYAAAAGFALDCDDLVIEHAAVVLSSASGRREFVDGASMYYGAPGAVPIVLPPEDRGDTNNNGAFALFRIPPGDSLVVQTWGFPDEAAMAQGEAGLVLVGEHPIHAVADSLMRLEVLANQ